MNAARPPKEATPAAVLPAQPPEDSIAGAHQGIEPRRLVHLDQAHRTLDQLFADEEILFGPGDDVEDGIADAENVEFGFSH